MIRGGLIRARTIQYVTLWMGELRTLDAVLPVHNDDCSDYIVTVAAISAYIMTTATM